MQFSSTKQGGNKKIFQDSNTNSILFELQNKYCFDYDDIEFASDVQINGVSGKNYDFDYLIECLKKTETNTKGYHCYYTNNKNKIGVLLRNYKKSCGTNIIIETIKALIDCNLGRIALFSNNFSKSAIGLVQSTEKNIDLFYLE